VVSFTPRPLYPQGKSSRYPLDRRLGGPQSRFGQGVEEKNFQPPPGIEPYNPDRPVRSLVVIPTKLSRLWFYVILNYSLTYLLTYLLTHSLTHSMVQDIIWKADSHSACQKISCFLYGTRRFITVFTKCHHWTLSWASRIQFAPSMPVSLRSILMLSSHLRLGLSSGLLPSGFPTKMSNVWVHFWIIPFSNCALPQLLHMEMAILIRLRLLFAARRMGTEILHYDAWNQFDLSAFRINRTHVPPFPSQFCVNNLRINSSGLESDYYNLEHYKN
jgi:hypothetical protein